MSFYWVVQSREMTGNEGGEIGKAEAGVKVVTKISKKEFLPTWWKTQRCRNKNYI